jgi:hypothetical protein
MGQILTLSIMDQVLTLSIMDLILTLSMSESQHRVEWCVFYCYAVSVVMLNVVPEQGPVIKRS